MSGFDVRESSDGHEFWRVETESLFVDHEPHSITSLPFPTMRLAMKSARRQVSQGARVQVVHYVPAGSRSHDE